MTENQRLFPLNLPFNIKFNIKLATNMKLKYNPTNVLYLFSLGQLAVDLARDAQTIQILNVKSVRRVTKSVNRLEGPLLKRSRFLGWKPVWVSNLSII